MKRLPWVLAASIFTLALAIGASGATFNVNSASDTADAAPGNGICADAGGACTMRAAISEANALAGADIINIGPVPYTQTLVAANEDLNAGGDWDITSEITMVGAGEGVTILQANAAPGVATERVIDVRAGANLTLSGVTVRNGRFSGTMTASTRGAGIENLGILTLNNVTVRDNQVSSTSGNSIAAGVYNAGTAVTLTNSTITANVNTRVVGGSAFGGGMASITAATIIINNSSISGNTAQTQATVAAFGFGAGLYLENVWNVTATNSHFDNNTGIGVLTGGGSNGGGVRALSNVGAAQFNATNCTFNGNTGSGGTSNQGTGIQFFTTTTSASSVTATLDRVTINGNTGTTVGIGLNSQLAGGNLALNIRNSTISNNAGGTNGGGIFVTNATSTQTSTGTINITNTTISGHNVTGSGGGIALEQPVAPVITMNLNYVTVANNRANNDNSGTDSGGGIIRASGTLNLKNSLIGDNSFGTGGSGPDISGMVNSQDYNHIEDPTGATIGGTTTNNTTGDANLGPLANNGGPTLTHLPGAGPTINAIPNGVNDCGTAVTVDQRQLPRPSGGACEKGSVEVQVAAGPFDLGGQVLTSTGAGIRNVRLRLTGGSLPQPLEVQTSSFGYYNFVDVPAGSYTLTVISKRFTFATPSVPINLNADIQNQNFTANPSLTDERAPGEVR